MDKEHSKALCGCYYYYLFRLTMTLSGQPDRGEREVEEGSQGGKEGGEEVEMDEEEETEEVEVEEKPEG